MEINSISMSGEDLKNLYDISGLTGADFAKRLGISRPTLYILFKDNIVEESVQEKISKDELLSKKERQLFNKPAIMDQESVKNSIPDIVIKGLMDTIHTLNMQLTESQKSFTKSLDLHAKQLSIIQADHSLFGSVLKQAHEEGHLIIRKKQA